MRKYLLSNMNKKTYRNNIRKWLDSFEWNCPYSVTLNLKQGIGPGQFLTDEIADKAIEHFLKKLDAAFFSPHEIRMGACVQAIVVQEISAGGRIHYHLKVDCPDHRSLEQMQKLISEIWLSMIWGYGQIDVQEHRPGWDNYITKWDTKPVFDESLKFHLWRKGQ